MDAAISSDAVPERRTKSWKREHEETCTRRYLSCYSGVQKASPLSGSDDFGGRSRFPVESSAESSISIDKSIAGERGVPCCDIDINHGNTNLSVKDGDLWENDRNKPIDNKNRENVGSGISESKDVFVTSVSKRHVVKFVSSGGTADTNIISADRETSRKSGSQDNIDLHSSERSSTSHAKSSRKTHYDRNLNEDNSINNVIKVTNDKRFKYKSYEASDLKYNTWEGKSHTSTNFETRHKNSAKYDMNFGSINDHISGHKESMDCKALGHKNRETSLQSVKKGFDRVDESCSNVVHVSVKNSSISYESNDSEHVKLSGNVQKKKCNEMDNKFSHRDRVRTEDMSENSASALKHFSKERRAGSNEASNLPDAMLKNCVVESAASSSRNDTLEKTVIPGILREIKESAYRETQITPLETYLSSCDVNILTLSNDTVGLCVASDGKVNVVMPRQKMKLEDKLSDTSNDPEYQEKILLLAQIIETEQRIAVKDILRGFNNNVASQRPDDRYFTKLDSSLKKNTAFVRKLKTFTGNQLENLLKEFLSLNLTKYVSEVATALVEAKLKMTDVWPAVQLCNIFHGTYSEFSVHLLDNWHKVLTIKKDEKIANAAKLRVDIRFYAELINVGIFTHKEGLPLMGNVLTMLTHSDKDDHLNINILLSFCRHCGDEYAGLVPRKMRELCEKYSINLPRYKLLPKEKQRNVKALLKDYFNSMCKHLLKEHLELQSFIRQNKKILQTKGELSSERKERLEVLQTSFDRIANGTQQFAEALDEDLPPLPEDESLKSETLILNGSSESEEGTLTASLWEDEETRRFYEYLPDMKEFMPSLQVRIADPEPQISEETLDAEFEGEFGGDDHEEEVTLVEIDESEDTEPVGNPSNKILLDAFLTALPNCINREMIDSAAVDFVMTLNTKHNRRKLVKTLFNVPRIRLDLLPFYARLVATLHPVMPDVATDLAQMLKQDFKYHIRKKDQMNIESKIKIVRFIGELVKFRMYSKIEGLYCVKVLVQDFTHHHIEMCCNLLESCGRFFFRHPDCHQRMKVYLDQMMRKKAVMALDSRYVTMIENAYYYVNPPESTQCVAKERPVEHQFIRKILYQMLMKSNTDKVLRLMRKLDWSNIDTHSYSVKCLTYAFKVKYFNIRCLASLLAGLVTQQETVGAQVVDGVLEDIRLGMEVNLPKYNQRRVAMIKYLGELYNYRMLESSNIFQVLYSLITFGVTWEHENQSPLDPPDNLFRIRLVCVLLETCGQYFISGMSKKKLDIFLVYFQHYFWFKFSDPIWNVETPFPVGINYMFKDTITSLRPNIHLFTSYNEATEAVTKLKMEESSTLFPQSEISAPEMKEESEENILTAPEDSNSPILDETVYPKNEMEDDDINEEEEEEDDGVSGDNVEREPDDDEDEDLTEPLSGDVDDGDMDWVANGDASHMSEGDSQSQEITLPIDSDGISYGPKLLECPEDEDFLTAFDRMVSDNIQDRMRETVKPQQVDISVPLHIKGNAKKTYEQLQEEEEPAKSSVNFILMLRKGHKQQYKSLEVPVNSEMALNLKNREEAERAEKEKVKRLTLDINERLEEEDYQEMLAQAQRPVVMNLNRERRHKYQHPKGAPDADLIFGPKKVR